jgi:hypothetical protein
MLDLPNNVRRLGDILANELVATSMTMSVFLLALAPALASIIERMQPISEHGNVVACDFAR